MAGAPGARRCAVDAVAAVNREVMLAFLESHVGCCVKVGTPEQLVTAMVAFDPIADPELEQVWDPASGRWVDP